MAETQFVGLRLHRRRGEAYKYYNALTSSTLSAIMPSNFTSGIVLNVTPFLPAGTFVDINGQKYVTRNSMQSAQWGEIDPINWHPSYIGPKDTSTFIDRAAVYYDEVNCCFTSVSTNKFVGYAVINGDLSTGTTTSGSTLVTGTLTLTALGDSGTTTYCVTSGTSADGQFKNYAAGDAYMEVEFVCSNSVTVSGSTGPIVAVTATGINSLANSLAASPGFVSAVGNNAVGIRLVAGQATKILNAGTGGLFVFPPSGGQINAGGANNGINQATLTVAEYVPTAANSLLFYSSPYTAS